MQEEAAVRLSQRHKEELKAQIAANEERERRQQAEYLLEGKKTRQKLQAEREFIEVSCNSCVCFDPMSCQEATFFIMLQYCVMRHGRLLVTAQLSLKGMLHPLGRCQALLQPIWHHVGRTYAL